jgi:hypothetical protein
LSRVGEGYSPQPGTDGIERYVSPGSCCDILGPSVRSWWSVQQRIDISHKIVVSDVVGMCFCAWVLRKMRLCVCVCAKYPLRTNSAPPNLDEQKREQVSDVLFLGFVSVVVWVVVAVNNISATRCMYICMV